VFLPHGQTTVGPLDGGPPPRPPRTNNSRRSLIIVAALAGIIVLLFPGATLQARKADARPLVLIGAAERAAERDLSLRVMVSNLNRLLANRIEGQVKVILKPARKMPRRADGGPSFGVWSQRGRQIWLWEKVNRYPAAKTLAHEAMHVLDSFWLTDAQRADIMALMTPRPSKWRDRTIGRVAFPYVAFPYEVFAVYSSAATVGFDTPPYRSLYKRRIKRDKWDSLARIVLRVTDGGRRGL
jgi:hypothetical protein